MPGRAKEDVRPIFWANRPQSYINRTESWDEFPNGRWGDAASPAFGDLEDSHFVNIYSGTVGERRAAWGESPQHEQEIYEVFANYIAGNPSVNRLPWCMQAVHLETGRIRDQLIEMNRAGFLTVNSQPRVCGISSADPTFGWGGPGGLIYQKAYVEFFCSPSLLRTLLDVVDDFETVSYQAVDFDGNCYTNCRKGEVSALTWGVFPNSEIIQPTVMDFNSFATSWKTEAFALWILQVRERSW